MKMEYKTMNLRILRNYLKTVCLYSLSLVMIITFYITYFSEGKQIILTVNSVGEANLEFIIIGILALSVIFYLIEEIIFLYKNNFKR